MRPIIAFDPGVGGKGRSNVGWAVITAPGRSGGTITIDAGSLDDYPVELPRLARYLSEPADVVVELPGGVGVAARQTSYRTHAALGEVRGYIKYFARQHGHAYITVLFAEWCNVICGANNVAAERRQWLIGLRLQSMDVLYGHCALDGHAWDAVGIALWRDCMRRSER